jgi:hypothetical protein
MKLKLACLTISCCLIAATTVAQQKYKAVMNTKFGQKMEGEIKMNLTGENEEMIEIASTEKTRSKGRKQTITTSAKYNVAIISNIVVDKQTYYFRDIRIGYDDKFLHNVCVKLIYGNMDCGIFQIGDLTTEHSIAIKFPKTNLSELASIDFDYYNSSQSVLMRIIDCKTLLEKMMAKDEAVSWNENATREQRFQRFKNIVDAYNKCTLPN